MENKNTIEKEHEICVKKRGPSGPLKRLSYNAYLTEIDDRYMNREIDLSERRFLKAFYRIQGKPFELFHSNTSRDVD